MCSVKAVDTLTIALPPVSSTPRTSTTLGSTISSDGCVRVYDLAAVPHSTPHSDEALQIEPLAAYDSKGSRLTCVAMADGDVAVASSNGKRKRPDEDEDEEVEGANEWAPQQNPGGEVSDEEGASEKDESDEEEEEEEAEEEDELEEE